MPGGRTEHLRKEHPEITSGYRENFGFDIVENYQRIKGKSIDAEEPSIDNSEKLKKYEFEEVGEYRPLNQDTYWVENKKAEHKPIVYAIVIENRAKYIGSTIRRARDRRLSLFPGEHKCESGHLSSKICQELKNGKKAKLCVITQLPNYDYKGLGFVILRDLETALINDLKTTEKDGGWNRRKSC